MTIDGKAIDLDTRQATLLAYLAVEGPTNLDQSSLPRQECTGYSVETGDRELRAPALNILEVVTLDPAEAMGPYRRRYRHRGERSGPDGGA